MFSTQQAGANSPSYSTRAGCISIKNTSEYPSYKILFGTTDMSDGKCHPLGGYEFQGVNITPYLYAVKPADMSEFMQIQNSYRISKEESAKFKDTRILADDFAGFTEEYPDGTTKTLPGMLANKLNVHTVEEEFWITSITTKINLDLIKKTYVYRDGTRKIIFQKSTSVLAPKPTPKPAPVPAPAPIPKPKPVLTMVSRLKVIGSGKIEAIDSAGVPTITKKVKLNISGTTSANAKITITIASDPITQEVTADKDGKWTFVVDPVALNLESGRHIVTAYATNSEGIKSDSQELTKFRIIEENIGTAQAEPVNYFSMTNLILMGISAVLLIGLIILIVIRRKKNQPAVIGPEKNIYEPK